MLIYAVVELSALHTPGPHFSANLCTGSTFMPSSQTKRFVALAQHLQPPVDAVYLSRTASKYRRQRVHGGSDNNNEAEFLEALGIGSSKTTTTSATPTQSKPTHVQNPAVDFDDHQLSPPPVPVIPRTYASYKQKTSERWNRLTPELLYPYMEWCRDTLHGRNSPQLPGMESPCCQAPQFKVRAVKAISLSSKE